jgi:hypothetical protein
VKARLRDLQLHHSSLPSSTNNTSTTPSAPLDDDKDGNSNDDDDGGVEESAELMAHRAAVAEAATCSPALGTSIKSFRTCVIDVLDRSG